MSDDEFDVLDQLYFVASLAEIKNNTDMDEEQLKMILKGLNSKGWVKVLRSADDEVPFSEDDFEKNYKSYLYLASKAGLLAHNGR